MIWKRSWGSSFFSGIKRGWRLQPPVASSCWTPNASCKPRRQRLKKPNASAGAKSLNWSLATYRLSHKTFWAAPFRFGTPPPPDIAVDCLEMDGEAQEKALLEGRIDVGLLLWGERPVLQLLQVRHLLDYPVRVALPRTHPLVERSTLPLGLLREESFVGLNRLCPTYGEWLRTVCQREASFPWWLRKPTAPRARWPSWPRASVWR